MKTENNENEALNKTDVNHSVLKLESIYPYLAYNLEFQYLFVTKTKNIEKRKGVCNGFRKMYHTEELLIDNNANNPEWIDLLLLKPILRPLKELPKLFDKMTEEEQNITMHCEHVIKDNFIVWQEPLFIIEILLKYHLDIYGLIDKKQAISIHNVK